MNDYKKLNMEEKQVVFENVWKEYSKTKSNNLYIYITIAAMILFSIVLISNKSNLNKNNIENTISNNLLEYDIYDDKEIIFDDSIKNMSNKDLDNIVAQL
jgi:low affinity Fe/Cu permease